MKIYRCLWAFLFCHICGKLNRGKTSYIIHKQPTLLQDPEKIFSTAVQFNGKRKFYSSRKGPDESKPLKLLKIWIVQNLALLTHCYSLNSSFASKKMKNTKDSK